MENQPFPATVAEWDWDTIETLADRGHPENSYLEYKEHLRYGDTNQEVSKQEWRRNIEREFVAFANANGGIIVFGMRDDCKPAPFEPPVHEISRTISQFVDQTTPLVETAVSPFLDVPSDNTDRGLLAVRVFQATRKPVATSDAAYYARVNDSKHPMNRDQVAARFVEADRRQQAIRQLELELSRFNDIYHSNFESPTFTESPPDYSLIDANAIRESLRENSHLFANEDHQDVILEILRHLRDIEQQARYYRREINSDTDEDYLYDDISSFNRSQQRNLVQEVDRLHRAIERLVEQSQLSPAEI